MFIAPLIVQHLSLSVAKVKMSICLDELGLT